MNTPFSTLTRFIPRVLEQTGIMGWQCRLSVLQSRFKRVLTYETQCICYGKYEFLTRIITGKYAQT